MVEWTYVEYSYSSMKSLKQNNVQPLQEVKTFRWLVSRVFVCSRLPGEMLFADLEVRIQMVHIDAHEAYYMQAHTRLHENVPPQ